MRERMNLIGALEAALDRPVQLVTLGEAERSPLLLAGVLREGRVLADRDGDWQVLKRRAEEIEQLARDQDELLEREAWNAAERFGELV